MIEPKRRVDVLLKLMRDAATEAVTYVDGYTLDDFLSDGRTQKAVAMNLVIMGELAATIARKHPNFELDNPAIELKLMRDMRNRIAHGYFDLDFTTVWTIVIDDLPQLIGQLDAALS